MIKKLCLTVISLLIIITLVSCGKSNSGAGDKIQTEAGENKETGVVTEETKVTPIGVILGEVSADVLDVETYNTMVAYNYFDLALSAGYKEQYPALAAVLNKKTEEQYSLVDKEVEALLKDYEAYFEGVDESTRQESSVYMSDETQGYVMRADSRVLSVCASFYDYQGGAHGMYGMSGENYDTKTGRLLEFSDVVSDEDKFYEIVDKRLQEDYVDYYEDLLPLDEYRKNLGKNSPPFIIDNEGVIIIFHPYSLGPYAYGQQVVKVLFTEAPEIFNDYYQKVCDSYVIPLIPELGEVTHIDINGDGNLLPLIWDYDYGNYSFDDEEYNDGVIKSYTITMGEKSLTIETYFYGLEKYVAKCGDNYYYIVFESVDSDGKIIDVIDLRSMKKTNEEYQAGYLAYETAKYDYDDSIPGQYRYKNIQRKYAFTNPNEIMIGPYVGMFGNNRSGVTAYAIKPSTGELVRTGDVINITRDWYAIKTLREIDCDFVEPEGTRSSGGSVPEGTYLCMIRTDGETWADFQIVDESMIDFVDSWDYFPLKDEKGPYVYDDKKDIIRIYAESTDVYIKTVDGIPEDEVFSGIIYAG